MLSGHRHFLLTNQYNSFQRSLTILQKLNYNCPDKNWAPSERRILTQIKDEGETFKLYFLTLSSCWESYCLGDPFAYTCSATLPPRSPSLRSRLPLTLSRLHLQPGSVSISYQRPSDGFNPSFASACICSYGGKMRSTEPSWCLFRVLQPIPEKPCGHIPSDARWLEQTPRHNKWPSKRALGARWQYHPGF